jgi:hypothetical protein
VGRVAGSHVQLGLVEVGVEQVEDHADEAPLEDPQCLPLGLTRRLQARQWPTAARVVRHARRLIVRLQASWPWAVELAGAFTRLRALPLRC